MNWNRLGYWVVKFLALAAMCAAVAGVIYVGWIVATWLAGLVSGLSWSGVRRGFYSLCWIVIFFYTVRFVRAAALWMEGKR